MSRRAVTFIIVIITILTVSICYINGRYQTVRQDYQTLNQQYQAQIELVKVQQKKLEALHQMDIQHTEELNNAKADIDKLHDAVRAGNKRLRVNNVYKGQQNTSTQSRHDEATPQPSETAREDYFHLREMIVENEKQTEYLQQYIKTQCQ